MKLETVFIGVIPGGKILAGRPFRTDVGGSYCWDIAGAKYQCEINGGKNRYYFVEERYLLPQKDGPHRLGNIKNIHHFNQDKLDLDADRTIEIPEERRIGYGRRR